MSLFRVTRIWILYSSIVYRARVSASCSHHVYSACDTRISTPWTVPAWAHDLREIFSEVHEKVINRHKRSLWDSGSLKWLPRSAYEGILKGKWCDIHSLGDVGLQGSSFKALNLMFSFKRDLGSVHVRECANSARPLEIVCYGIHRQIASPMFHRIQQINIPPATELAG